MKNKTISKTKKERIYKFLNFIGTIITALSAPGLLTWIPTPIDLGDGVALELIFTIIFSIGTIIKSFAKLKLNKINKKNK